MPVFQSGQPPLSSPTLTLMYNGWNGVLRFFISVGLILLMLLTHVVWADDNEVLEYTLRRTPDGVYHVYMRPTVTPTAGDNYSLTGQITLKVPTGTGANKFMLPDEDVTVQSMIPSVAWSHSSRANAPTEDPTHDYLSFTLAPYGTNAFAWQAGVELEVFSFSNINACTGWVEIMQKTDSFGQIPNSVGSNAANQFTNLGWGSVVGNNYLGNYGGPVNCGDNQAPIITSDGGGDTASITIPENQAAVTQVTATDADNDTLTYSLSGGADQAKFMIHSVTGQLSFIDNPIFGQPADVGADNTYNVQVKVDDGNGGIDTQDLTISIVKSNLYKVLEYTMRRGADGRYHVYMRPTITPTSGFNYSLTGQITLTVPTNNQFEVEDIQSTIPSTVWANRARVNAPVENPLVDYISFDLAPYGSSAFNWQAGMEIEVFNFRNPNVCSGFVDVMENTDPFASFNNSAHTQPANQFTNLGWGPMTANNYLGNYGNPVDCQTNRAPIITSNGGGDSATVSVPENQTVVTQVVATDADNDTLTYAIIGGVDKDLFMINSANGKLVFITAPNFDVPTDAGNDNTYNIQVLVDDGRGGTDTQSLAISVTKSNIYKVLEYSMRRSADGRYHVYMRPTMTPAAGMNYSLTGQITLTVPTGVNDHQFLINDLQSNVANVVWANRARVNAPSENTNVDYISFDLAPYGTQAYNWQAGVEIEVFNFTNPNFCVGFADVMENNDPFAKLNNSANTQPANQFTNLGWGPMTANNYLGNYGGPVDCTSNFPPVITSDGGGDTAAITRPENAVGVTTVTATDLNNDTLTFSISGGVDAALFKINATTGQLEFIAAPDYEHPLDVGANNIYDVQVTVSDGNGGTDIQAIAVTVADVFENQPPVIISDGGGDTASLVVLEGRVVATTVVATDPNHDVLVYSIIGGADASMFTINAATGLLSFKAPSFMGGNIGISDAFIPPKDSDNNNIYEVIVRATDPFNAYDTQALSIRLSYGDMLQLQLRAWLQGPFDPNTQLMSDKLRTKALIPQTQPYNSAPFNYAGSEVTTSSMLLTVGLNAPVDWVLIELRSATSPDMVLWRKAAMLERDGDIVDPLTGSNRLVVNDMPLSRYFIAVRHRNHLGVLSAVPVLFTANNVAYYDFGFQGVATWGTDSRLFASSKAFMWAGDTNQDKYLKASDTTNSGSTSNGTVSSDLITIRNMVLSGIYNEKANSNYKMSGYISTDVNLDGVTLFTGPSNDPSYLMHNIIRHPANTSGSATYTVPKTLP